MTDKLEAAMHAVAAFTAVSLSGVIKSLGEQKAGLMLLVAALAIGVTGGAWGRAAWQDLVAGPDVRNRIEVIEDWIAAHESGVSQPGLDRIHLIEQWIESDAVEMRAMVYEMYCDRFPDRCNPIPRE